MEPCIYYNITTIQFLALIFGQSWKANYALECDTAPRGPVTKARCKTIGACVLGVCALGHVS